VRSDRDRVQDILEAIDRVGRYTANGREAFDDDELIQVWVVRHLQVIGEASRLSQGARDQQPDADGIVLSEPIDEGPVEADVRVPVLVLGPIAGLTAPRVIISRGAGEAPAAAVTEHLLALGHQTVHHVAGPQRWFSARERLEGWRGALRNAGADEPEHAEGDWSVTSGYAAGKSLAADPDVTAVFAANDDMAIGVIRALAEAGRTVPDEVSVVGFDDIPNAAYLNPPLTTVNVPFDQLAEATLAALVKAVEAPSEETPPFAEPECRLVVRSSTAPPLGSRTVSSGETHQIRQPIR
jgi:DNA-binding LacI/PurR family transcriptional regulator